MDAFCSPLICDCFWYLGDTVCKCTKLACWCIKLRSAAHRLKWQGLTCCARSLRAAGTVCCCYKRLVRNFSC